MRITHTIIIIYLNFNIQFPPFRARLAISFNPPFPSSYSPISYTVADENHKIGTNLLALEVRKHSVAQSEGQCLACMGKSQLL